MKLLKLLPSVLVYAFYDAFLNSAVSNILSLFAWFSFWNRNDETQYLITSHNVGMLHVELSQYFDDLVDPLNTVEEIHLKNKNSITVFNLIRFY